MESVWLDRRFNGPPATGNGGYVCGVVAGLLGAPVTQVTLWQPPPLGHALDVVRGAYGVSVRDGDDAVADAEPASLELDVTEPVDLATAEAARAKYAGLVEHPFPTCFVCGPARDDGLGLRPGRVSDGAVATSWTPDISLDSGDGRVSVEFAWAALDCPGAWGLVQNMATPIVLGRLVANVEQRPLVGRPHVVMGWAIANEGRKHFAGTAIWDADGVALAYGRATWIARP